MEAACKNFLRGIFFLLPILIFLCIDLFFPKAAFACSDQNIKRITLLSGCTQSSRSYCSDGTTPRCNVPPGYTAAQCPGTNSNNNTAPDDEIYEALIEITYNTQPETTCSSTAFFLDLSYCTPPSFPRAQPGGNGIQGDVLYPTCTTGTCNGTLAAQDPNTYTFTGECDTSANSFCTGGLSNSCPTQPTGHSPGIYCQSWACGWNCNVPASDGTSNGGAWDCTVNTDTTHYGQYGTKNQCQDQFACPLQAVSPPSCTILVNGSPTASIANNSSANLSWSCSNNPTSCTASDSWTGSPPASGSQSTGNLAGPNTYTYTIECSNSGGTSSPASATVEVAGPGVPPPTPTQSPNCAVSASSTSQTSGTGSVNMVGGRDRVDWFLNGSYIGTNAGPSADFNNLNPNTAYTVSATEWSSSGSFANQSCATGSFITGNPGSGGGGGNGVTAPPTPTSPPQLVAAGHNVQIRFWDEDGVTPYDGADTIHLLVNYQNGNRNYYANRYHNSLFYGTNGTYPHNGNQVGVCDATEWHPFYDPGYQINADGTFAGCPAQNLDSDSMYKEVCDQATLECSDCCGCTTVCTASHIESGNDACMGYGTVQSSQSFPRCFSPELEQPITINAQNHLWQIDWDGTRNDLDPIENTFSVGAPTGIKIKVSRICDSSYCDFNSVLYPSGPTRGQVVKDFDQTPQGYKNYFAQDWFTVDGNTGDAVYDVFVKGSAGTISGQVNIDNNCDGRTTIGYGGDLVSVSGPSSQTTTTNGSGNYSFASLTKGSYTVTAQVPSGYRACSSNTQVVNLGGGGDQTGVNFSIAPVSDSWFQTKDADLLAAGKIVSKIPQQCTGASCSPYLSLIGDGGFPGVPMYSGSTAPDFGYGSVSQTEFGWLVKDSFTPVTRYNYAYFSRKIPSTVHDITDNELTGGAITNSGYFSSTGTADSRGYKWFKRQGDLVLDANTNLNNGKIVLFVSGNLTIKNKITINGGGKASGFFATIVQGSITIDPAVSYQSQPGPANNAKPALEGLFLSDIQIRTGSQNPTKDSQLYVRGVLASWGSVLLQRDLEPSKQGSGNDTTPSEYIEYAPDLIMNLPPELLRDNPIWEEVAP